MSFNVQSDIKAFSRGLDDFRRRQIPFATANAISTTLFDVRKKIVGQTFDRSFTVRNKRFAGAAMRVKKARKKDLEGSLFDRLGRTYLETQARGGTKRPRGGRIAIPTKLVKRTSSGKVPKGKTPRVLRAKPNVFVSTRRGTAAIVQRTKSGLKVLHLLVSSARIPKRFRFYEDSTETAVKVFDRNFGKAFEKALKTAK